MVVTECTSGWEGFLPTLHRARTAPYDICKCDFTQIMPRSRVPGGRLLKGEYSEFGDNTQYVLRPAADGTEKQNLEHFALPIVMLMYYSR